MDCDAGSSRGEGFRRGDSAPGLPRGVGFGSRAGGSGSLRSPFVDVDSPSLPMVTARERLKRRGAASGSAAAARHHSGSVARERCAAAGPGARTAGAAAVVSGQLFFARRGAVPAVCPRAVGSKGL